MKMNKKNKGEKIKNKILTILTQQKRLTNPEIKQQLKNFYNLEISENDIRVYLKRLFDKDKIKKLDREGHYVVYTIAKTESIPSNFNEIQELLKFLNNFFKNNQDYLFENETILNYVLEHKEFDKIEEVIKPW